MKKQRILKVIVMIQILTAVSGVEYKSAKYEVEGKNINIEMGAKEGWESIKVEGKYKYITITEVGENLEVGEKLYVNKKGEGGRVEEVAEEQAGKIRAILESIKSDPGKKVETKDRIIEELQVREVKEGKEVIIGKEEKEEIEGARAGYIPYAYETGGKSGIYHVLVVGENGEVKYVISGEMSGKSKVYGEEKKESINELVGKESEESKEKLKEIYGIVGNSIVEEIGRKQGKMIYNPGDMSGASEYLVEYMDMLEKENRSILEESLYGKGRTAQAIGEEEREKIVRAAERYLSWGVEYKIPESETKGEKKIYNKVRKKWGIENEGDGENNYWAEEEFPEGNAIAYVKGGIDTPRTFWKKLGVSYEQKKRKFFWLRDYTKVDTGENYTAGRNDDSAKGTGVDSEGFITGVISMSGLKGEIGSAATNLDNYTKNINKITGEELKGTTGNSAASRASMRYGLREIEEYSVIIADRGRIRRGDILVKSDGEGDSIAVVVEVKGSEKEEIEVVYIKEEKGGTAERVKWSELEGREKYTARRLVTYEKEQEGEKKEQAASSKLLSVLDGKIDDENSKVNIEGKAEERQTNQTQAWRFIPNTGEYLVMRMGKIELKNESGIDIGRLYGEELEVKIKGKDRGYKEEKKPEEGNKGNIYINKAKEFEVAYIQPKHKEVRTLKKKEKEEEIYEIEEGAELRIGEDGKLKYGNERVKIGIRPKEKEIYPGDDLIIGLEIKREGKVLGEVWSEENDYIAVYDKKLLWRANLYIKEAGGNDWNDIHPWNAPKSGDYDKKVWYGLNEWKEDENGGQTEICSWTRWSDDESVIDSVAYGWGCDDSVKDFNDELDEQREAAKTYRAKPTNGIFSEKDKKILQLPMIEGETQALGNEWLNYIFPNEEKCLEVDGKKLKEKSREELYILSDKTNISVPGLSTYWYSLDMETSKYYRYEQAERTSGVDCSGLTGEVTQYSGNKYGIVGKQNTWYFATETLGIFAASATNSWNITISEEELREQLRNIKDLTEEEKEKKINETINKRDEQRKLLSYAVPGDILVVGGSHVVIIQDLNYERENTVITDYSQVEVIHSTKGLKNSESTWNVVKGTWENIQQTVTNYQLRRLTK